MFLIVFLGPVFFLSELPPCRFLKEGGPFRPFSFYAKNTLRFVVFFLHFFQMIFVASLALLWPFVFVLSQAFTKNVCSFLLTQKNGSFQTRSLMLFLLPANGHLFDVNVWASEGTH
jgi:hypothetical protein